MNKRMLGMAALVGAGLVTSSAGFAYTLIGIDWAWQGDPLSQPFDLNPQSFPSSTGTLDQVRTALRTGMDRWGDDGGADFAFTYGGESSASSLAYNGDMVAAWSSQVASGGTLAVASTRGFNGNMDECDIRFYSANGSGTIDWSADPSGAAWFEIDLEQVSTHEFGHCAGLDHSSSGGAVMFASYRSGVPANRELSTDDKNGLVAMYGEGGSPGTPDGFAVRIDRPIVASQTFNLVITEGPPNRDVFLAVGLGGEGDGPCFPALGGQCVDIVGTIISLGAVRLDGSGGATFPVTAPASAAGTTVGFQAAAVSGPQGAFSFLSEPDSITVASPNANCPSGWVTDCNALCVPQTYIGDGYCDDGETNYNDPNTGFNGASDFLCNVYSFDDGDCAN